MARGINPNSKKNLEKGKRFSKENQPPPENKSAGHLRLKTIEDGFDFIGQQVKMTVKVTDEGGQEQTVNFSYEAAMAKKVMEMAANGNLKAFEQICKIKGIYAATKSEVENYDRVEITIKGKKPAGKDEDKPRRKRV